MTKFHRFKCRSLINCPPSLVISPSSCLCRLPVYPPLEGLRRAFGGTKDPIRNLFIEGFFSRYSLLQNDEETTLVILFGICSWGRFFTRLWRVQNDEEMGPLPLTLFRVRMTWGSSRPIFAKTGSWHCQNGEKWDSSPSLCSGSWYFTNRG